MSRMWSPKKVFDEKFAQLSTTDKAEAYERMKRAFSVCLRQRGDIVELVADGDNVSITATAVYDGPTDERIFVFNDQNSHAIFIGAPVVAAEDNPTPLMAAGDGETPEQFWLRHWNGCTHDQRMRVSELFFTYDHAVLLATFDGAIEIYSGEGDIELHDIATASGMFLRDDRGNYAVDMSRNDAIRLIAEGGSEPIITDFEGPSRESLTRSPDAADAVAYAMHNFADTLVGPSDPTLVEVHPAAMKSKALYATLIDALMLETPNCSPRTRALYTEATKRLSMNALSAYEASKLTERDYT